MIARESNEAVQGITEAITTMATTAWEDENEKVQ